MTSKFKSSLLDRPFNKAKMDIHISAFALLFSEIVQHYQNRVHTVAELHEKLSTVGQHVGFKMLEILCIRERNSKREVKLLNILQFIRSTAWKAEKLEHSNDDERTYYIIESESLVNKFISVPKDKSSLNCAAFMAGIIEAMLTNSGFAAKVSAHWHKGTTFIIKFEDSVIAREKRCEEK